MAAGYIKDKPDVSFWLKNIREGTEWRNKVLQQKRWGQWRKWYRGDHGQGVLPVNLFFKMLRTLVPRVYLRNPGVSVLPRKHQIGRLDFWVMSRLLEQVDNALYDRMQVKDAVKMAVQDAFMFSTGFLKLGYGGEFSPTPDLVEEEEAPITKKGQKVEYNANILPNTPWLLRAPTDRIIYPKNSLDFASARWYAHRERRNIDDVREDARFSNAKNLEPGVMPAPGEDFGKRGGDIIDCYEIRDKKTNKVFVIAATQSAAKPLFYEDDELARNNKQNIFPIQFNRDDEYCWGVSDSMILDPHQIEVNAVRRTIRKHRRISLLKWFQEQGVLSPDEAAKMMSEDEVGSLITLNQGKTLAQLKEQQAGDIPAGLLKDLELENQMVQEILGMGVNQFGEYAPGSSDRSATEATIVNQAVQIRTDERRDIVADALVAMTEHLNFVLGKKWTDAKQLTSIIGPEGQQVWVEFMQTELSDLEYDVHIDPDSAVPETKQLRQQKAQAMYQMFSQDAAIDGIKLRKFVLNEMIGQAGDDFMAQQAPGAPGVPGAPPGLAPGGGGPGASPQQPAQMAQVIDAMSRKKQGGGGK